MSKWTHISEYGGQNHVSMIAGGPEAGDTFVTACGHNLTTGALLTIYPFRLDAVNCGHCLFAIAQEYTTQNTERAANGQQDKRKDIEALERDLVGSRMFLVRDHMGNCDEQFDTMPKAIEHAETLVEEYSENAGDGWSGDGDIDVLQVVKRWSLLPIPTPPGEDPTSEWADMLEAELPALPNTITKERVETVVRSVLDGYVTRTGDYEIGRIYGGLSAQVLGDTIMAQLFPEEAPTDASPG